MDVQHNDERAAHIPAKIDEQHKALVVMFNDLHARVKLGKGEGSIEETLLGLSEYMEIHFTYEEQIMEEANFSGLETHREQHQEFAKQVNRFCESIATPGQKLELEVIEFLRTWILDHINNKDDRDLEAMQLEQQVLHAKG